MNYRNKMHVGDIVISNVGNIIKYLFINKTKPQTNSFC